MDELTALLGALHREPQGQNWRARWMRACELCWELLSNHTPMSTHYTDLFLQLLLDSDKFSLARLVVVDFRTAHPAGLNTAQQRIVDASQQIRLQVLRQETTTQKDFDDPIFVEEKRILQDAELHRARVLFHYSGAFGSISSESMRQWLDAFPGNTRG